MIHKIKNHSVTKHSARILSIKLKILLFIVLPLVIFTLVTSKTDIVPGLKSFVVISGSMEPTLPVGSVVYTKSQSQYGKGDVISFTNDAGQTVTHRVIDTTREKNQIVYSTKGDANDTKDTSTVTEGNVLGKVVYHFPYVGQIINFVKTPVGFIFLIVLPTILFVLSELWKIKVEIEKEVEKRVLSRMETK